MSDCEEFNPSLDSNEAQHPARDGDRQSLFMHAALSLAYLGGPQTVRIRNLSKGGVMVETALTVQVGEAFVLDLPNVGQVSGRVAWTAEGRFGAAFDAAIDPMLVRRKVVVNSSAHEAYVDLNKRVGRPAFGHLNRRS